MALPVSPPSAEGVDARSVLAFLDALDASTETDPHGIVVLRHGRVVAAGWWAPYSADRWQLLYSLSKSFTSTAAGAWPSPKACSTSTPRCCPTFPELDGDITDAGSRAITVRACGGDGHRAHSRDTWQPALAADPEPVRGFLHAAAGPSPPGSAFAYNQPATHSVAAIIQRVTGQTLTEYLRPRLFDPLGVPPVVWHAVPTGPRHRLHRSARHHRDRGQARAAATCSDGRWRGTAAAGAGVGCRGHPARRSRPMPRPEVGLAAQGYGFQFWMSRHGYRGDGAYGQFCLVLPEQAAVVAITSATARMQSVLDDVWTHLLPGFGQPGTGSAAADRELAARLTALALPPVPATAVGQLTSSTFEPFGGHCADQPSLTSVTVRPAEHGGRPAQLTLHQQGEAGGLTADIGTDGWVVTGGRIPMAASGGRVDAAELRVDVLFLDTPHRLSIRLNDADATFTARWITAPLGIGRLEQLEAVSTGR